ncbi:MAG TPA: tetratricopeptide repeat protein, partial [Candidatus Binatia bacterium]|nr:tetratricopeptide repeat protein [Candidatus Binatia bacterium]
RVRWALAAVAVAAAVWVVNEPTLDYGFAYDDQAVVQERPPSWQQGGSEFLATRGWGVGRHAVLLSLDLDRRDPLTTRPFRITNLVLATANALLVLALAHALGLSPAGAITTALLFAVQPTHVDAVVSIVGRAELMAAFGVLGALWLHVRGYGGGAAGAVFAGVLFFIGLASKESAVCIFVLLALLELFRPGPAFGVTVARRPRGWPLAYLVAVAVWLLLVARNFATVDTIAYADNPLAYVTAGERILAAAEILWRYVASTVWPFGLRPDLGYAEITTSSSAGVISWLAWAGLVATALALRRRAPLVGFSLLWLPAAFAVTGNVVMPIGTMMAERLLYLPSVGPCLLAGAFVDAIRRDTTMRRWGGRAALAVALLALAIAYDHRARVWIDDDHYHEQAVALSPRSAKAHYNLGLSYARRGLYEESEQSFARALAVIPRFAAAAGYRAEALRRLDRVDDAVSVYEEYLRAVPDDVEALRNVAGLQELIGRNDDALRSIRRAVELAPERADLLAALTEIEARARRAAVERPSPTLP